MTFYTSEQAFRRRFETTSRTGAFSGSTRAEAETWQREARARFRFLLGLERMAAALPEPVLVEKTSLPDEGLTRETWRVQTEADVWMPLYLFIPDGLTGPAPLVLCPHGHGSAGKHAVGGRRDLPGLEATISAHNYDYGVQIARRGFITACPDARGFGERREPMVQSDAQFLNSSCHQLTLAATPLGLTVMGMWTFDLLCLLDWAQHDSRVNADRIGCAGLSGGGLQTLALSAVEPRIDAAVVSGYFYGARESLQVLNGNCMCNMVPGLWEAFDMGDLGGLLAGRNLFIETGDADPLNGASGVDNVTTQVAISHRLFDLLGGNLTHDVFAGGHRWHGESAIPWVAKHLL